MSVPGKSTWSGSIKLLALIAVIISVSGSSKVMAQESENPQAWDNLFYVGNRVSWGPAKWKSSAELQFRLQDNTRQLQQYFVEYIGTYFLSEHVEIAPDFRIAVKPDRVDFRPGLGVVLKYGFVDGQLVQQFKWQIDIESTGGSSQTLRYFPSYNRVIGDDWIVSVMTGGYYKFSEEKNGISALIVGAGVAYVINKQHTINASYLYAEQQNFADETWFPAGGLILRLIININKEYKYTPAKYINF